MKISQIPELKSPLITELAGQASWLVFMSLHLTPKVLTLLPWGCRTSVSSAPMCCGHLTCRQASLVPGWCSNHRRLSGLVPTAVSQLIVTTFLQLPSLGFYPLPQRILRWCDNSIVDTFKCWQPFLKSSTFHHISILKNSKHSVETYIDPKKDCSTGLLCLYRYRPVSCPSLEWRSVTACYLPSSNW